MRYITLDDLQRAIPARTLIQLSNDDPAAQAPDEQNIELAVTSAEELVDGFLRARYVLPLSPVPTIIRELTLNLVRYRLYARRPEGPALPETVKDQHEGALAILKKIQTGEVTLGVAQDSQPAPEAGAMKVSAPRKKFGTDTLTRWR